MVIGATVVEWLEKASCTELDFSLFFFFQIFLENYVEDILGGKYMDKGCKLTRVGEDQ